MKEQVDRDFYLQYKKDLKNLEQVIYEFTCMVEDQSYLVHKLVGGDDNVHFLHPSIILAKYLDVGAAMRKCIIKENMSC